MSYRSNNRVSNIMSGAFGGVGSVDDVSTKALQQSNMARMSEEAAAHKLNAVRRENDPDTIARRAELDRVNEENALSQARHLKEVNDNYGDINNLLNGVDVEDDASYEAGMSNLPAGVYFHKGLARKIDEIENKREGVLRSRYKQQVYAEKARKDGLKLFESEASENLSPDSYQAYKRFSMDYPDASAEDFRQHFGEEINRNVSAKKFKSSLEENMKAADDLYSAKSEKNSEAQKNLKAAMSLLKGLEAKADGVDKLKGADAALYKRVNSRLSGLEIAALEAEKLQKKMDETRASGKASIAKAQYDASIIQGLTGNTRKYIDQSRQIRESNAPEKDKQAALMNVANSSSGLYNHAYTQLQSGYPHLFDGEFSNVPAKRQPIVGSVIPPSVLKSFNEDSSKKSAMFGGKIYYNPFNPPTEDEIGGEVIREGFKASLSDPVFKATVQTALERQGFMSSESQDLMMKALPSVLSKERIDEDVMSRLTEDMKYVLAQVAKDEYHTSNKSFPEIAEELGNYKSK